MFNVLVRRLHLKNFKSVVDNGADLKSLTVIVGSNSAGKSTLMQSLLLLSQSLRTQQNHLSLNGSLVDLGYFGDVKNHQAKTNESVIVSVDFELIKEPSFLDIELEEDGVQSGLESRLHIGVEFNDEDGSGYPLVNKVNVRENTLEIDGESTVFESFFENLVNSDDHIVAQGRISNSNFQSVEINAIKMRGYLPSALLEKQTLSLLLDNYDLSARYTNRTYLKRLEKRWQDFILKRGIAKDPHVFVKQIHQIIKMSLPFPDFGILNSENQINNEKKEKKNEPLKVFPAEQVQISSLIKKLIEDSVSKARSSATLRQTTDNSCWYFKESYLDDLLHCEFYAPIERNAKSFVQNATSPVAQFWHAKNVVQRIFESKVRFLGPIRQRSIKPPPSISDRDLGRNGEYAADRFLRLKSRDVYFWDSDTEEVTQISLNAAVVSVLTDFGLAYGVSAHDGGRSETVFKVTPQHGGKEVDLSAVGTGVSQLLPVLMAVLLTNPGEIVVIEQPELHLNPALEKALATFLLDSARCGRQIVVETHSEHLVNRLRRHIAEGTESEREAIGILFAQQTDGITHYHPAEISEIGGIVNWPPGFLDLGANEAKELLKAAKAKLDRIEAESSPNTSNSETVES